MKKEIRKMILISSAVVIVVFVGIKGFCYGSLLLAQKLEVEGAPTEKIEFKLF